MIKNVKEILDGLAKTKEEQKRLKVLEKVRVPLINVINIDRGIEHIVGSDMHDLLVHNLGIQYYNEKDKNGTCNGSYQFDIHDEDGLEKIPIVPLSEYLKYFYVPYAEKVEKTDNVNNPAHYCQGGIKVIDYLKAKMTAEEFKGFLRGNVLKYVSRAEAKGKEKEDYEKALWYLKRLITEMEEES